MAQIIKRFLIVLGVLLLPLVMFEVLRLITNDGQNPAFYLKYTVGVAFTGVVFIVGAILYELIKYIIYG